MHVIFEEDGHFKAGSILSETEATAQVEAASGKRSKVKAANILLRFAAPAPSEVMTEAETLSAELDADFLWEAAGSDEFGFEQLAQEYYGHAPRPAESAALLLKLHGSPIYFHKKGKGRYRPAPAETLAAAKAGQEKKRLAAERQATLAAELSAFRLPPEYVPLVPRILIAPDKNTLEYKALEEAAATTGLSQLRLLDRCGAIPSTLDFHRMSFTLEWFPRGTEFAPVTEPVDPPELPKSSVRAFSMDDEATTEIDDALSVQWRDDGSVRVGIHIAAPALGIAPGSELDRVARERLSTVYFPGDKITMLPEALIHHYTLGESHDCPALSLYVDVASDLRVLGTETKLEQVHIADNLRHETLETQFNDASLKNPDFPDYPYRRELEWLRDFAAVLEAGRGKADTVDRVDYNFKVDGEHVRIEPRKRGSPIDKVVSELMIFANAHWGGWLAENRVPGIYRAQAGGKTRMTTSPDPHVGLGVDQYAWSTSPLRRYVDLVNQRQLISLVQATDPVYLPRSEALFATVRDFELAYDAYADYQRRMERYWMLRWLIQENVSEVTANVIRDDLVRFDSLPLVTRAPSVMGVAAGAKVRLAISAIDLLDVSFHAEYVETVAEAPDSAAALP
ncbi:MAG: ribonuclease II [Hydrogenophilales bacterium 16-64-46]|nr:MAG: ribonuclease II [Hydrogenophilales bacterium 12-64-13]OYZ05285.1 MAG: ribonuclease II [Hydrogenophilales bacterium 16-64-46]OZA37099.1 MAG: ribonuclease II [Hydrogenophilales bacterium 17-64-34]HQS99419.1 RNB domain-containing ribonuclease [Thiobacillus sp.]